MKKIEDLLKHVDVVGKCWVWKGAKRGGYGRVLRNGRLVAVHVLVFEQEKRRRRPGEVIRHRCNNRACIRPSHLLGGSQRANVLDSVRAGTHRTPIHYGETHPLAKLSAHDVVKIKKLAKRGLSHSTIATHFPVQRRQISRIISGQRWKGPADVEEAISRTYDVGGSS